MNTSFNASLCICCPRTMLQRQDKPQQWFQGTVGMAVPCFSKNLFTNFEKITILENRTSAFVPSSVGLHITLCIHIVPRTTVRGPFLGECIFADSGRQRLCQKHFNGI